MATLSIHRKTLCFQLETPEIEGTNANSIETTELSGTKSKTHETPNIETNITVAPNIPTGNRFSLLQDCETDTPSIRRSEIGIEHNTDIIPGETKQMMSRSQASQLLPLL